MGNIDWSALERSGYVLVQNLLSEDQAQRILAGYNQGPPPSVFPFGFKPVQPPLAAALMDQVAPLLDEIRQQTELRVDTFAEATFFSTSVEQTTARTAFWHQEFDLHYFLSEDHVNYLNFYVPLLKAERARSNVGIVPFDALRERHPWAFERFSGGGARRFVTVDGRTLVYSGQRPLHLELHARDAETELPFDLDEIAVFPELGVGDLLVVRGDVIHRTQDAETERVSVSLRVVHGDCPVRADGVVGKLMAPGIAGLGGSVKARQRLGHILGCFEQAGRLEVTMAEMIDYLGKHMRTPITARQMLQSVRDASARVLDVAIERFGDAEQTHADS